VQQFLQTMKAAMKRADTPLLQQWVSQQQVAELPNVSCEKSFSAAQIGDAVQTFHRNHHWQHNNIHPCFPLFLGLSQHVETLSSKASPFPLMGLVHIENNIEQTRPLTHDEMHIHCHFSDIRVHPRGIVVDIVLLVKQHGSVCQTVTSTYLYRAASDTLAKGDAADSEKASPAQSQKATTSALTFASNAGRRYARISGDYNPIHLYHWSAKLFGFKQAIAHGVHVLSRSVSSLDLSFIHPQESFSIANVFHYPVTLPSELTLRSHTLANNADNGLVFELRNPQVKRRKQVLLCGQVTVPA